MKKILSFFLCLVVAVCGMQYANAATSTAPSTTNNSDAPTCVEVGNVNVTVNENKKSNANVKAVNYNSYPVTVRWKVYGTNESGKTQQVAGGTIALDGNGDDNSAKRAGFQCPKNVCGLWVEARVEKCD